MNHNAHVDQGGEPHPLPDNHESNRRHDRQKSNIGRTHQKRASAAARIESNPDLENGNAREYSAGDLNEAVIWVRNYNPNDSSVKPLINTEQYLAAQKTASKSEVPNKSELKLGTSNIDKNRNSVSQKIEHFDAPFATEQVADLMPTPATQELNGSLERNYFWNQADAFQADDRDVLPAITDIEKLGESGGSSVRQANNESWNDSSLAEAVNPNDPSYSERSVSVHPQRANEKPNKKQKSGFMTRRREKRAVQSQQMEAETFNRLTPATTYNELVPEESAGFADAEGELERPVIEDAPSGAASNERSGDDRSQFTRTYPEAGLSTHKEQVNGSYAEQSGDQANVELSLERTEQLDLARTINIDGVSVYEMFTAGRIDEEGLHRIIVEFLRGGDLRDVIKGELIRQQLKFERDPQLRGTPVDKKAASKTKTSRLKNRTKSIMDPTRNHDRTEKLAEFTQNAVEKTHEYLDGNPKAGQMMGIAAIVVIYLAILIVAIAK